jgi:hypothetical protein
LVRLQKIYEAMLLTRKKKIGGVGIAGACRLKIPEGEKYFYEYNQIVKSEQPEAAGYFGKMALRPA